MNNNKLIIQKLIEIEKKFIELKNKGITEGSYRRISDGKLKIIKGLLSKSSLSFKVDSNGRILKDNSKTHNYTINMTKEVERFVYSRLKNYRPFKNIVMINDIKKGVNKQ